MRKVDLAGRFERTLNLVRLELQGSLTHFFETDQLARSLFLDAIGIRFVDSVITDYDRGLWRREGSQLFFLPIQSDTKLDGMFERAGNSNSGPAIDLWGTRNVDWHSHLAAAAASLFGTWVFFYDRARGSYYFPFPRRNYQFCRVNHNGESTIAMPAKRYRDAVEPLLRGFSLEVGQGSLGLARRLDRDVIVEDTLTDPRGSVALEDLVLRNFSFYGFVMCSTDDGDDVRPTSSITDDVIDQSRFGASPFGLLGLIFPAPLRGKKASGACLRLYEYLRSKVLGRLTDTLEPLACHIDDTVLREALRTVASSMAERATDVGGWNVVDDEELRRRFAAAVAGRGDPFDETSAHTTSRDPTTTEISNLRDPFAIGAVHLLETSERGKGMFVRAYWHGENSIGRGLRERVEADQRSSSADAQSLEEVIVRNLSNALTSVSGGQAVSLAADFVPAELSGFGSTIFGTVWAATTSRSSNQTSHAAASIAHAKLDELQRSAERWASRSYESDPTDNSESAVAVGRDLGLTNFSAAVRRHKIGEAILTMLGNQMTSSSLHLNYSDAPAAYVDLLGRCLDASGRRDFNPWLWGTALPLAEPSPSESGLPILTCAAYLPKLGLEPAVGVFNDGIPSRASTKLCAELFRTHTYRTLLLLALYGKDLPPSGNSSKWRAAQLATLSSPSLNDEPLRSGVYSDENRGVVYGLATSLSDSLFWEQILNESCPHPPEWVLWRKCPSEHSSASVEVVLASSEAKDDLCATGMPTSRNGFAIHLNWTAAASRWSLYHWHVAGPSVTTAVEAVAQRTDDQIISGQPDSLLKVLGFCKRENESRRASQDTAPTSCFPRVSSASDSMTPSALRTAGGCPCPSVTALATADGLSGNDIKYLFAPLPQFVRQAITTNLHSGNIPTLGAGAISTVWPLSYSNDAASRGAIVLSMPETESAVRRRAMSNAYGATMRSLSGLATALISQSVDYLEFVLRQMDAKERFRRQLGRFSHSLQSAIRESDAFQGLSDLATYFIDDMSEHSQRDEADPTEDEIVTILGRYPTRDGDGCERAKAFHYALHPLRLSALPPDALDKLQSILGRLYLQSRDYGVRVYETRALLAALTKTLAGLPEIPASESSSRLQLEPSAANLAEWLLYLLERQQESRTSISAMASAAAGQVQALQDLFSIQCYPPATISIVIDELCKNSKKHGSDEYPRLLTIGFVDCVLSLSVANRKSKTKALGVGSGLGMETVRQIVRANTGVDGVVIRQSPIEYNATVSLDLQKYRTIVETAVAAPPIGRDH